MTNLVIVYQGSDHEAEVLRSHFYSSEKSFALEYGDIKTYSLSIDKFFDSADRTHIKSLLDIVGYIVDTYDDVTYTSYEELDETGILGSDTWEAFEPHSHTVKSMGFDGMIVYEGGCQNFLVFDKEKQLTLI